MHRSYLILLAGLAGLAPVPGVAQENCEPVVGEISDIEQRLSAHQSGAARGFLAGLASTALGYTPYASVSDSHVAQAVADSAQGTARDAAVDAVRGEPAEPSSDPKADRKRLKELKREARSLGCH